MHLLTIYINYVDSLLNSPGRIRQDFLGGESWLKNYVAFVLGTASNGHLMLPLATMSKFACTDKYVLSTFSKNFVIKDLGWCQLMELYLVADIYQPDCLTFSQCFERMYNNLPPKMIEKKCGLTPLLNKYILLQIHFANKL